MTVDKNHERLKLSLGKNLDQWGAILGLICALHCIFTPLSMVLVQISGLGVLWTTGGELMLLVLAMSFTIPSLWEAWQRERSHWVLAIFLLAWGIIIASHLTESSHHYESVFIDSIDSHGSPHLVQDESGHEHSIMSVIFASLGGFGLMFAHLLNIKEKRIIKAECRS